tara:strand:+ start:70 stop:519 length:450 start_codon:yes stop_codon:yes gene_type:complete
MSSPQTRGLRQQRIRTLIKSRSALTQRLLDFTTSAPLLPLSRLNIMTRQPPELTKQGPIVSSTTSLAIHNCLGSNSRLKHTAPAAQILQGHSNTFRNREFRGTTAAQSRLEASEGADHHALNGQLLLLCDQDMSGLMHGDATQATLTAR